jgi:carboxylesterase
MKNLNYPGGRDAVLLVHGLCSSPLEMQYLGRQLSKAGLAVFIPHLAGYGCIPGESDVRIGRWEDWHAQVARHFDALKLHYRNVSLCGLCIGADLCLSLAAERDNEVAAQALLSTILFYDGWNISPFRALLPLAYHSPLRRFYPRYRERSPYGLKNERLRKWVEQEMKQQSQSSVGAAAIPTTALYQAELLIGHVKRLLPRVTAPTLLIHAKDDDVASVRSPDYVAARINARVVRQCRLADSYHMVTVDNEKEVVARRTIGFFREILGDIPSVRLGLAGTSFA